mmetsp:Transcript_11990/g.31373  ORF Transcript_11990/g.31373 Transcript_11990/m.31373 type:complete len:457 (-) Transcript_11990:306-1676(-)
MDTPIRAQVASCAPHAAYMPDIAKTERGTTDGPGSSLLLSTLGQCGLADDARTVVPQAPLAKAPHSLWGDRGSSPPASLGTASEAARFCVQTSVVRSPTHPIGVDYTSPVISQQRLDSKSSVASDGAAPTRRDDAPGPVAAAVDAPTTPGSASAKEESAGGHWSQRSVDGSVPASSAAVNASCQWLGRTVRVTRGKGEGLQGIVTKSGHGFYCVHVSDDETLMKRGHEIELVGGGSLRPKAPRSPAQGPHAKLMGRATSPGSSLTGSLTGSPRAVPTSGPTSRVMMRSPSPTACSALPEPALPVPTPDGASYRCEGCARVHHGGFGTGRFCSKSCGARFAVRSRAFHIPTPVDSLSVLDGYHAPIAIKAGDEAAQLPPKLPESAVGSSSGERHSHALPAAQSRVPGGAELSAVDTEAALAARTLLRIMSATSKQPVQPADGSAHASALLRKRQRVC